MATRTSSTLNSTEDHRRARGRGIVTVWAGYFVLVMTISVVRGVPPDAASAVLAVGFALLLIATSVLAWAWEQIGSSVLLPEGAIAFIGILVQASVQLATGSGQTDVSAGSVVDVVALAIVLAGPPLLAGALLRHDYLQHHWGEPASPLP